MRLASWLYAICLVLTCMGCAADSNQASTPPAGSANPVPSNPVAPPIETPEIVPGPGDGQSQSGVTGNTVGLPAFPGGENSLASPVRQISDVDSQVNGTAWVAAYGGNNGPAAGEPTSYLLIPAEDENLAWAMFTFPNLVMDRPVEVSVDVAPTAYLPGGDDDLPLLYWIGVADYTEYKWDWSGPFTSAAEVRINSNELTDRFVSAAGRLHLVVAVDSSGVESDEHNVFGLAGVQVNTGTATTATDYLKNKPHFSFIDSVSAGSGEGGGKGTSELDPAQHRVVEWSHIEAFGPHDIPNRAFIYQVLRRGPTDLFPEPIGSLLYPTSLYNDPLDNAPGTPEPNPGTGYRYYLQAINNFGYTPLSAPVGSTVPVYPPENLAATMDTEAGYIGVTWDAIEGVKEYQIWRSATADEAEASLLDSVPGIDSAYGDASATPGVYYWYWVVSVGEGFNVGLADDTYSDFSLPALGLRAVQVALSITNSPAPAGSGTSIDPYILVGGINYMFRAEDQDANITTGLMDWNVEPVISARFSAVTPGLLEDVWASAGSFSIVSRLSLDAYTWEATSYCHVTNDLP